METDCDTFFAPPERASDSELQHAVRLTRDNAVLNSVLQIVSGLVAILNR